MLLKKLQQHLTMWGCVTKIARSFSPKNQTETELVKEILSAVSYYGFFWRNNTGRRGGVSFGYPGSADILGVCRSRFIAFEAKKEGNGQSDNQILFEFHIKKHLGCYFVVCSAKQAVEGLMQYMEKIESYNLASLLYEIKMIANGIVGESRNEIVEELKELVKKYERMDIEQGPIARRNVTDIIKY